MKLQNQRPHQKYDKIRFRPSIPSVILDANTFDEETIQESYLQWDRAEREWKFLDDGIIRTLIASGTTLAYHIFKDTDPSTTPTPDPGEYQLIIHDGILWIKDDKGNVFMPPATILSDNIRAIDGQSAFDIDENFSMLTSRISINSVPLTDDQYEFIKAEYPHSAAIKLTEGKKLKLHDLFTIIY